MGGVMKHHGAMIDIASVQPITQHSPLELTGLRIQFADGKHIKPTAAEAQKLSEYAVRDPGVLFGVSDGAAIPLESAVFNSHADTVKLKFKEPHPLASTSAITLEVHYANDDGLVLVQIPGTAFPGDAIDAVLEGDAWDEGKGLFRR